MISSDFHENGQREADFLKQLANPKRLLICSHLVRHEEDVNSLAQKVGFFSICFEPASGRPPELGPRHFQKTEPVPLLQLQTSWRGPNCQTPCGNFRAGRDRR